MSQQNAASNSNASNAAPGKEFFDLHTRGIGYLNRARWVSVKGRGGRRSDTFLSTGINALHGDAADPNTTLFDCRVTGDDAQQIVKAVMPDVDAGKKVFIAFTIGDTYAHPYERKVKVKDDKTGKWIETGAGEMAALIKGRLLRITNVKIDGEVVYRVDTDGVVYTTLKLGQAAEDQGSEPQGYRDGTTG
jgi:hypothetical protein